MSQPPGNVSKAGSARNPMSLRLYKVLNASYDDKALQEALDILDNVYEDTDTVDPAKVSALNGAAARARSSLKRDIEIRSSQGSQRFLSTFKYINNELNNVDKSVQDMHARCKEAEEQLQKTNKTCNSLLERAGGLRALQQVVENHQLVVHVLLMHFTLTDKEVSSITSTEEPIGRKFFDVMQRAEMIKRGCRILISEDKTSTKAGAEIMSLNDQYLEEGYEKIARWCLLEFRKLGRDAHLEVNNNMRESVRWLQNRFELLSEVIAVLAQTRQAAMLNAFTAALTRGGPHGLPRPIEIHAHDPLRYVGDMLGWVHQAVAEETEFLDALFDVEGDNRMVGSVRRFQRNETGSWIQGALNKTFEKLCTPLKARIRQTIRLQESCITCYRVVNVLQFYTLTMIRTIGADTVLSRTLVEITDEAYRTFSNMIDAQARNLSRSIVTNPDSQDLQPPLALLDHTQILRELMSVYQSALMGDESEEERRAGFASILNRMIDAALDMCQSLSETKSTVQPAWDKIIFMLNSITHIQNILRPYAFTDTKVDELEKLLDEQVALLTHSHYNSILKETCLEQCIRAVEETSRDGPLSRTEGMEPATLKHGLEGFANWLSSPDVVRSRRLSTLLDQRLNHKIHVTALRQLADAYERMCIEVRKPENKYEAVNTILGGQRPFGQKTVLLQILGLDAENTSDAC